jgi:serine/threonine protein kinase
LSEEHFSIDRPPRLSEKALNFAHDFLGALFMGVRTAQLHDPTNAAFTNAVARLHESAQALFAAAGGIEVQVVDESFFINGVRLRFNGKTYESMRTLRRLLEAQEMGGFKMRSPPTYDAVRRLVSLFTAGARASLEVSRQELAPVDIGVLGVQRLADGAGPVKVDRRVFALHSYAKLILALREHAAVIQHLRVHGPDPSLRPRIRVVRVIQDLTELCDDRLDLLLKLASNPQGAPAEELASANTCVAALAMAHALELHRRDIGDIGMAALFTLVGRWAVGEVGRPDTQYNGASVAHLMAESGVGQGLYTRAMVLTEQAFYPTSSVEGMRRAHPFSRLVRVAHAYAKLITGLDTQDGRPVLPLEALRILRADKSGWLDPRFVDVLVNLLRAYPRGTQVVLTSGRHAMVSQVGLRRWDRPTLRVAGNPPVELILESPAAAREEVAFTQAFLGTEPPRGDVVQGRPEPLALVPEVSAAAGPSPSPTRSPLPSLAALARQGAPGIRASSAGPGVLPVTGMELHSGSQPLAPPAPRPAAPPAPAPRPPHRGVDLTSDLAAEFPPSPPPADAIPILDAVFQDEPAAAPVRPTSSGSVPPSAYSGSAPNRLIGTYLAGKYRILQKLGEGGMGVVYIANQEPIDRKVAVKVLLSSLAGDEVAVKRFEQEAKAISRMRHPNTVTIYDFGKTAAGELYIVMEYLEGETLAELLRREGEVAPDRAARIIRQACASLSEAHAAGIIHRDLKPDNLFLTSLGGELDWVKVLDFGLAKLADNETTARLTQRGKVFGTPRYMSPEQAQGLPLDGRSDLYTLGVVLYELLTGQALFSAETMVALLVKHISEAPAPLGEVRPDLRFDPRLEAVVMRALAKDPETRHASVEALAHALEPFAYATQRPQARLPVREPSRLPPPLSSLPPADSRDEDLDLLLSDFLRDLTPLEHLGGEPENPFDGYTPLPKDDEP